MSVSRKCDGDVVKETSLDLDLREHSRAFAKEKEFNDELWRLKMARRPRNERSHQACGLGWGQHIGQIRLSAGLL
jgi:hypothetical protein